MMWVIKIPGKPIAKKRPRFARRGKFVTTYNDQETEESRALWEIKQQIGNVEPTTEALKVSFDFWMPIPKSVSKKKAADMQLGVIPHLSKPDCSNLVKFYEDILNGYLWKDDSQITELTVKKRYSDLPGTIIEVEVV